MHHIIQSLKSNPTTVTFTDLTNVQILSENVTEYASASYCTMGQSTIIFVISLKANILLFAHYKCENGAFICIGSLLQPAI